MSGPSLRWHSVEMARLAARRKLPRAIFDFVDGGADGEAALRGNASQFEAYRLVPRVGVDVSVRDQSVTLFGRRFASPLGIGPTGLAGLVRPKAELMLMRAAEAMDVPFTLSTVASTSIEEIGEAAKRPHWFQLYILRDRSISNRLVERAAAAGFETLVVTLDCPVGAHRERDLANAFSLPYRPSITAVLDTARRVPWLMRLARNGTPQPVNMIEAAGKSGALSLLGFMDTQLNPAVTWEDVRAVRRLWKGALVVKGILSEHDVAEAHNIGADGIIVSNHGGRQLGASASPLFQLPAIAERAAGRLTVLYDSGIRRGMDAVKALALGADGLLVGRPTLFGAAADGMEGARGILELLRADIDRTMALIGACDLAGIGAQSIVANEPQQPQTWHGACPGRCGTLAAATRISDSIMEEPNGQFA